MYKRYDAKKGKTPPPNFEPAQDKDPITGHQPGWLPVGDGQEDKWHREAYSAAGILKDGSYELCGPSIQCNRDKFANHVLIPHGQDILEDVPRTYSGLRTWLADKDIEGIVWHHPDGRLVKIKKKDFPKL